MKEERKYMTRLTLYQMNKFKNIYQSLYLVFL